MSAGRCGSAPIPGCQNPGRVFCHIPTDHQKTSTAETLTADSVLLSVLGKRDSFELLLPEPLPAALFGALRMLPAATTQHKDPESEQHINTLTFQSCLTSPFQFWILVLGLICLPCDPLPPGSMDLVNSNTELLATTASASVSEVWKCICLINHILK